MTSPHLTRHGLMILNCDTYSQITLCLTIFDYYYYYRPWCVSRRIKNEECGHTSTVVQKRKNNLYSVVKIRCRQISITIFNPRVIPNRMLIIANSMWNEIVRNTFFLPKEKSSNYYGAVRRKRILILCANARAGDRISCLIYELQKMKIPRNGATKKMFESFSIFLGTRNHRILNISYAKRNKCEIIVCDVVR